MSLDFPPADELSIQTLFFIAYLKQIKNETSSDISSGVKGDNSVFFLFLLPSVEFQTQEFTFFENFAKEEKKSCFTFLLNFNLLYLFS